MVTVSLPPTMTVAEDGGTVMVCATLSNATMATDRDFMITLATSDDTATGKTTYAIIMMRLSSLYICYSWV